MTENFSGIKIDYVKGIESLNIKYNFVPNKPTFVVAPNGFGKSSIACAFKSMNSMGMRLDKKNYYMRDEANEPTLDIEYAGRTLVCNKTSNSISEEFNIITINSSIFGKSTTKNRGKFTTTETKLKVPDITLYKTIPAKVSVAYSVNKFKTETGIKGALNIDEYIKQPELWYNLSKLDFSKINQKGFLTAEQSLIKDIAKKEEKITPEVQLYNEIASIINFCDTEVEKYVVALQIVGLARQKDFNKAMKYMLYKYDEKDYNSLIEAFNTTKHEIKATKDKKSLVIEFPDIEYMSNGERDILQFVIRMKHIMDNARKDKTILIIDEIFDYLDDANLVAFQYYITTLIDKVKSSGHIIYPLLLTHLDPAYFKHTCFESHKIKVCYLTKHGGKSIYENLIKLRDTHDSYEDISNYYFHYNPDNNPDTIVINCKLKLDGSFKFYEKCQKETAEYLDSKTYDCIAILFFLRHKIEKVIYNKIPVEKQSEFLDKNGTKNKLIYAESNDVAVDEIFYLLGVIYNDFLHPKQSDNIIVPLVNRLENITIKSLIRLVYHKEE